VQTGSPKLSLVVRSPRDPACLVLGRLHVRFHRFTAERRTQVLDGLAERVTFGPCHLCLQLVARRLEGAFEASKSTSAVVHVFTRFWRALQSKRGYRGFWPYAMIPCSMRGRGCECRLTKRRTLPNCRFMNCAQCGKAVQSNLKNKIRRESKLTAHKHIGMSIASPADAGPDVRSPNRRDHVNRIHLHIYVQAPSSLARYIACSPPSHTLSL
jgi:hypothetical protein